MNDISQELLHELLRRLHQRIDKTELVIRDLRAENNSLRRILTTNQIDIANFYETIHRIEDRLDRIETRLELRDFSERGQQPFNPNA